MVPSDGFYVSNRDLGSRVWFLGTRMDLRAEGEHTHGVMGLIEQVLPPGFAPPMHIHHGEDEAFYLLEGQAVFTCGEQQAAARPGTFVFLPRGVPHGFRIEGDQPARLLQFTFPAGLENFFREAGAESGQAAPGPAEIEKMLAAAPAYRLEILGPSAAVGTTPAAASR